MTYLLYQGDEKVIDDAFKERDPQRHCAMKGLPGRVSFTDKLSQAYLHHPFLPDDKVKGKDDIWYVFGVKVNDQNCSIFLVIFLFKPQT